MLVQRRPGLTQRGRSNCLRVGFSTSCSVRRRASVPRSSRGSGAFFRRVSSSAGLTKTERRGFRAGVFHGEANTAAFFPLLRPTFPRDADGGRFKIVGYYRERAKLRVILARRD